ncbi:MAG: DUF4012 domain-containing protein [Anaerolineae bacterium]
MTLPEQPSTSANVTTTQPLPAVRRRRRRRSGPKWLRRLTKPSNLVRLIFRLVLFTALVGTMIVVGAAVLVTNSVRDVENSLQNLNRVVSAITSQSGDNLELTDFERLKTSLNEVISTLSGVSRQARLAQPFLSMNSDLTASVTQLRATEQLARAADAMVRGLEPTLVFLFDTQSTGSSPISQISTGERLVELLSIGRPNFLEAETYLQNARETINTIDVSQLSSDALLQLDQLLNYESTLTNLQSILAESPDLLTTALGLGGQASFLVLSANSDEIRPSGGYISTYGWLLIRNGRIEDFNYSPTTATSPNPPPTAMASEVQVPPWWLQYQQPLYAAWDGSWTPDFPTTAEMAMWYYNNGSNPESPVDGVINIDIVAFEAILQALGRVQVPDYNTVVTPANFRQVVYEIRADTGEHKAFLAALYRQIFEDWQTHISDPQFSSRILGVLLRSLQEKHLMIYFADPTMNHAMDVLGWSGQQTPIAEQDYLMVVDANLGNKSNSSIRRQELYDVELAADGSALSHATVLYDYSASIASADPAVDDRFHGPLDYSNLLQVYTPAGSTLTETAGSLLNPQVVTNDLTTQFVSNLVVPYDTSDRFQFVYSVPDVVQSLGAFEEYNLLVQKQPGMRQELVIVQVTLPEGASLVDASPEPTATYSIDRQILEFRIDFRSDTAIRVIYSLPQ